MVAEQLRAALPPPTPDEFPETGGEALPGAEYEVDYVEPPAQFDATTAMINDDSGVVGVTQGTVEGTPTLEVLGSTAEHDDAPRTMPGLLTMCVNHERCGRALRTQGDPCVLWCCDVCVSTDGCRHAEHCDANQIDSHVPGSAEMEATLNDIKPAPMDF